MDASLLTELLSLSTLSLATADLSGKPHVAPVYFAADLKFDFNAGRDVVCNVSTCLDRVNSLQLYFFSDQDSQHAQHLASNPRAAGTIYPVCTGWQDIRGLQLHGQVSLITPGAQWELSWELYRAKFPFVSLLKPIVARNTLYCFNSTWLRMSDNRRGFGSKEEKQLPDNLRGNN
jgi:uncharacterized protein YhbP (UPF0306 family)